MLHFSDNSRHLGLICSDNLSGLSYELFYSAGLTNFFLSIVGRGLTSNNASKENNGVIFYGCIKAKLSTC